MFVADIAGASSKLQGTFTATSGGSRPVHSFIAQCHCTERNNTMAYLSQFPSADSQLGAASVARSARRLGLASRITSIAKWVRDYLEEMADLYAAVAMYEQLRRLSDAELRRRGLTRENLASHVLALDYRAGRSG
jgi:hypothetical protein